MIIYKIEKCRGEAQYPGEDVQRSGEDVQHSGEDVQCFGEDIQCLGEDVRCLGEDVQCLDEDVRVPAVQAVPFIALAGAMGGSVLLYMQVPESRKETAVVRTGNAG